uniref:Uncharacterized protein n=1 Tax=Salix viminalis TaxID=40686 RepID=A0A6N2LKW7_SALVM
MHGNDATGQLPENANSIELLGSVVGAFRGSQVSTSQVAWSDAFVPAGDGKGSESNSSEMIISSINHDGQQIPGADISGSKNIACQIGAQEKSQGTTDGVQVPVNSEVVAYSTERQKEFSLPSTNSPPPSSVIKTTYGGKLKSFHLVDVARISDTNCGVDDPIASVRKLFMSPTKRTKLSSGSS